MTDWKDVGKERIGGDSASYKKLKQKFFKEMLIPENFLLKIIANLF